MNARRKLFFFGKGGAPVGPGQALFDAYKTRIETDSGTVRNDAGTLSLFQDQISDSFRTDLILQVAARAGNRLTTGNVNKSYSLDSSDNDVMQGTVAEQPILALAPDSFDFENTRFLATAGPILTTHFSVSVWINRRSGGSVNGIVGQWQSGIASRTYFGTVGEVPRLFYRGDVFFETYTIPNNTWVLLSLDMDSSTNTARLYANGVLVDTVSYTPGAIHNIACGVGAISGLGDFKIDGKLDNLRIWNDRSFPAQFYLDMFNAEKGYYGLS